MEPPGSVGWVGPFIDLVGSNLLWIDFGLEPSDADIDAHADALEAWARDNRAPFGALVVLHSAVVGTATQRRQLAALEKRLAEHDRRHARACAIVAPNAVTRGLVTAVYWIAPPVYPYRLFEHAEPALRWVQSELDAVKA